MTHLSYQKSPIAEKVPGCWKKKKKLKCSEHLANLATATLVTNLNCTVLLYLTTNLMINYKWLMITKIWFGKWKEFRQSVSFLQLVHLWMRTLIFRGDLGRVRHTGARCSVWLEKIKGRKSAKQTAKKAKEELVPEAEWADKAFGTERAAEWNPSGGYFSYTWATWQ